MALNGDLDLAHELTRLGVGGGRRGAGAAWAHGFFGAGAFLRSRALTTPMPKSRADGGGRGEQEFRERTWSTATC